MCAGILYSPSRCLSDDVMVMSYRDHLDDLAHHVAKKKILFVNADGER